MRTGGIGVIEFVSVVQFAEVGGREERENGREQRRGGRTGERGEENKAEGGGGSEWEEEGGGRGGGGGKQKTADERGGRRGGAERGRRDRDGAGRRREPGPGRQPGGSRWDMCTATLERGRPALSASSGCEIMGFSRIHSSSWRSRWVTGSPPKQKFVF